MLGLDAVQPSPRDALMLFSEQLGLPVGCSLRHVNEDGKPNFGEQVQLDCRNKIGTHRYFADSGVDPDWMANRRHSASSTRQRSANLSAPCALYAIRKAR